ncbi:hypothetical protein FN846DRAFT_322866 [Sphaerosporella brunnea]|uniref:Uncharacterized protein n=1 Tax=Sphaerosporella brunnea TaxID=1250544 RepID=A0A5J5F6I9_9PEZI|nr:hypothetical protein FN846DRAFT_322866 [Sphaerosporella brunnea]
MSSDRPTLPARPVPRLSMGCAVGYGCVAGVIGVFAMTATEKAEQLITGRPDCYVPALTLTRLLGVVPSTDALWAWNMAMNYGQGMVAGAIRGVMALYGIRGPIAHFMFTGIRLAIDQTLENYTEVGAPPWTWPAHCQVIDLIHKAAFALVTGYFAERWI